VHASKGLEFPVVFLVAMERNVFPNERAEMERSLDEELRLFYVAITRAKNELVMTYSRERMYRGVEKRQVPSRFLHALPEELVDKCGVSDLIQTLDNDEMMAGFANIFAMLQND
jgi:superfamily I DNA/RNA helicase